MTGNTREISRVDAKDELWFKKPLEYGSIQMKLDPIDEGVTLNNAARELAYGGHTYVTLEPGDGTNYKVAVQNLGDRNGWLISYLNSGLCKTWPKYRTIMPWDLEWLSPHNEWTRVFLAWWLNNLIWESMEVDL